jgi:hypothetical protein
LDAVFSTGFQPPRATAVPKLGFSAISEAHTFRLVSDWGACLPFRPEEKHGRDTKKNPLWKGGLGTNQLGF